jgi:putative tricarboxylic transport membrane protein
MDFGLYLQCLFNALQPHNLLVIFAGCLGGILVGSLPGLTATMGVALLVPFSFGMEMDVSIGMLLGLYCGAMYGGSISSILIHTPGTPAAAATMLDGYPLSQQGQASRALSMSLTASFIGGILGCLIMTFLSPQVSIFALKFSTSEYFALAVFGLSIIVSISSQNVLKGVMSGFFGLILCTVGSDPISGYPRYIFGQMELYEGPPFIPTLIGLFAVSEILSGVEKFTAGKQVVQQVSQILPTMADVKRCLVTIIKGGVIGSFIGSIPGAGGDIAAFVSYGEAKRSSNTPEKFGTGMIEGVAASESANNGCTGGAMIPLLSLGVPGDSVTAILLGAFIIHGLQPGPLLYKEHIDVVYMVFASMLIANIAMFILGATGVKFFARVIGIDKRMLLPIIMVLSLIGSYSMRNSFFDVFITLGFGVVGYLLQRYGFPLPPILLALILGPMAESNLRRTLVISQGDPSVILHQPIAMFLLILAVLSLVMSYRSQRKVAARMLAAKKADEDSKL